MISVIIPVYNTAPYLRQCVDSLLNQTYKDIEVFLIDDGSTDSSGKICDEYAGEDDRVTVIHQSNQGVSAARNAALKYIKGEWVSFIDSDDWTETTMFEKLIKLAVKTKADIVACDLFDEKKSYAKYRNYWNVVEKQTELVFEDQDRLLYGFAYSPVLWNKLLKTDLLHDIQFSTKCRYGEDSLFLSDAAIRAKRISCLGEPLYHYRSERDGNVVSASFDDKLLDVIHSYDEICEKLTAYEADMAIGQLVYSASLQVIFKLPLSESAELYYKELKRFIKKYKSRVKMLRPNYRVTSIRLILVKMAAFSPKMSIMIWNVKSVLKN